MRAFMFCVSWVLCASVLVAADAPKKAPPPKRPLPEMPAPTYLWPEGAPGAKGSDEDDKPALWVFLPEAAKANGTAVVVCPGGGYGHLAYGHEGKDVAELLNAQGVAVFVLRYRLAPKYGHPAPMLDVQRALRTVRAGADKWKLDPKRVGVMGFSAGGHLASTAATHFDAGKTDASDPIDHASCRPDFAVLCYPVIAFGTEYAHGGSQKNLLGAEPDPKLVAYYANHTQVTPETPPTFLFHTNGDTGVVPENSVLFYLALRKAKVPAEMHIYEFGKHGVGLAKDDPVLSTWSGRLIDWMRGHELIAKPGQ
ncbi:MAG TPA: alpha/beta hydrolase [Pirellulales bacterium]|nr:alpha/beta hydrolase [Pirellulales bacterium]